MLRGLYDKIIKLSESRHALPTLAAVSFAESSFFPIPPDVVLVPMALAQPQKARLYALVCTIASVLGGILGYAIGALLYDSVGQQLLALLGLSESFPQAACYLREYGAEIIMIKGATPIPFKLLTITAGFIGMALVPFILASVVSRTISFMLVGVLFRLFGAPIKRFIDKYLGWVTAGFVVLVVGGFILATMLSGGSDEAADKCAAATMVANISTGFEITA